MKKIIIASALIAGFMSCNSDKKSTPVNVPVGVHATVVEEVLQTSQYTYLHVKEAEKETWLAVTKMPAAKGETYYYRSGLVMNNFESKELKRTFPEILFIDNISNDPNGVPEVQATAGQPAGGNAMADSGQAAAGVATPPVSAGSKIPLEKKEVKVQHGKDEISIASLWSNKKNYAGKKVKVKGQVTKYNGGIMQKNWIHIQDGTAAGDKFDMTITTNQEVAVGETIIAEGIVSLDKDFGYGYLYEVIIEDAKISK